SQLLRAWSRRAEANMRAKLAPHIDTALDEVGLVAASVPERVSRRKLSGELLDQIVAHGYISIGHLRDSLSRSNVKMQSLQPRHLLDGDALLKADLILSRSLDGVYRRGEIYLRALQKLSSIPFGTPIGRVLTLYLILPVLGAYVLLQGLSHTVGLVIHLVLHEELHWVSLITVPALAAVLFALLHVRRLRELLVDGLRVIWSILRLVLFKVPAVIWSSRPVQAIVRSSPAQALGRYVLKPALFAVILAAPLLLIVIDAWTIAGWSWFAIGHHVVGATVVFFLAINMMLNSRHGRMLEEATIDALVRSWRQVRRHVLPGVLALVIDLFKGVAEVMDRAIYTVDELLRFRHGDSGLSLAVKATLGVFWFFITYAIRIYVNLLIEPELNPIKHFPVVTVAAKIMAPFTGMITSIIARPLVPLIGSIPANSIGFFTVFVLPGFFGFLAWELEANWRLYDINRSAVLDPVRIGHHGETMVGFMKPGLHSGTIPKLYAKLRHATWKRQKKALGLRSQLHDIEESIERFVERELVPLLEESAAWTAGPLEVNHVVIASNRVRIEIDAPHLGEDGVQVAFEEQSGWLLATVLQRGFLDRIDEEQRLLFENALVGLYKMAGVDLVREQNDLCV
ncbi:MAG: hypothetical protein ABI175_28510, partial [Polyangiales bacterium]